MACRLPLFICCVLLAGAARAAELGEPRVNSFIGQPLVADIELGMLEDAATPVQVRLAHPDVYRGAGIGMPAVLSTLRMSVMRRDGRQFLHVTSLAPVESEHLHLYLELADGSQRTVRLATLWLSPDPNPARPAALAAAAPSIARAEHALESAPKSAPRVAALVKPVPARPKPATGPPRVTAPAPHQPGPPPAGGACTPQPRQQVDACVMLGSKNAMLREQLGQLEDKVRVLQVAAGAAPAALMQPARPHKPKQKEPEEGAPWLLVGAGAGVLALLAGLVFALRGRKAAWRAAGPRVGAMAQLKARLKAGLRRKGKPDAALEPGLEESAHDSSTQG